MKFNINIILALSLFDSVSSLTTGVSGHLNTGTPVRRPSTGLRSARYTNSTISSGSSTGAGSARSSIRASGTLHETDSSTLASGSLTGVRLSGSSHRASGSVRATGSSSFASGSLTSVGFSGSSQRASGTVSGTGSSPLPSGTQVSSRGLSHDASFLSVSKALASETAPVIIPVVTTTSGSTITFDVISGESLPSLITLPPASSTLLYLFDPEVTSSAFTFGKKLENVIREAKKFEEKKKKKHHHHDGIGPILGILKRTVHWGEHFLSKIKIPKIKSSGCSASIVSLAKCAIKDVEDLTGKIKGNEDDIGPLLDDLGKLADQLKGDDDEDQSSITKSSSTSSSTCSASVVRHCTNPCVTTIGNSAITTSESCTLYCTTVTGCDITASTSSTTSTSSVSSQSWPPLDPYSSVPDNTAWDMQASKSLHALFVANSLLPITTSGTSSSATSSSLTTLSLTTSSLITSSFTGSIQCSTTISSEVYSESSWTSAVTATGCACNNGAMGYTETLPDTISGSSPTSYLACKLNDFDKTITMSTLAPSATPTAAINIMLGYYRYVLPTKATWYLFSFPDTVQYNSSYIAEQVCPTNREKNTMQTWPDLLLDKFTISSKKLYDKDFLYPNAQTTTFDVGHFKGCLYGQPTNGSLSTPGYISCNNLDETPCVSDVTPLVDCSRLSTKVDWMIPKVWCHL